MSSLFFGSLLPNNASRWPDLLQVAEAMDAGAWRTTWVYDQFLPPEPHFPGITIDGDCFEGWSLAAGLAASTRRVRVGVLVSGNTYRNPALLAKMAATVDHISDGRLEFGIGAAWYEREHRAYGWDFPSMRERSERLEEACALIRLLFRADGPVTFTGRYYRLDEAPFAPLSLQRPHPPMLIGGGGEKRTLRTVARYGDVMNVRGTPAGVAQKIAALERHCAEIGRDPAEITKTIVSPLVLHDDPHVAERHRQRHGPTLSPAERNAALPIGGAAHIITVLQSYQAVGVQGVILTGLPNNPRLYERIDKEIVAAFR